METFIRAGFKHNNVKKTNAIDFHNRIAARFNDKYQSSKTFRERFQVWTRLFEQYVKPADRVIDLGCGPGVFSNYLADKGCVVMGIDGSAAMIALCEQYKPSDQAHYIQASLPLDNPLRFAPQDVALLSSVLEYLTEPAEMLAQVNLILRLNGLLFVSIPNQQSVYRMIERVLFWLTKRPAYIMHSRCRMTQTALTNQLAGLGFERLETVYFSSLDPISRLLKPFFANRCVNNLVVGIYQKRA